MTNDIYRRDRIEDLVLPEDHPAVNKRREDACYGMNLRFARDMYERAWLDGYGYAMYRKEKEARGEA